MKDWTGNRRSTFATLGASSHADHDRETNDYYATDPKAAELLLDVEPELSDIWEPACGAGHLANVFEKYGKLAKASDLIDRGYGKSGVDFFAVQLPSQWRYSNESAVSLCAGVCTESARSDTHWAQGLYVPTHTVSRRQGPSQVLRRVPSADRLCCHEPHQVRYEW